MFSSKLKAQSKNHPASSIQYLVSRKGQQLAEYALVFSLVLAALITMQTYVRRGLQGRVRDAANGMSAAIIAVSESGSVSQYEPYYIQSDIDTDTQSVKVEQTELGGSERTTVNSTTTRQGTRTILPR